MLFWCKWHITKTSECAEMLSFKVCLLQHGSESNFGLFINRTRLASFLPSDWDFFLKIGKKRGYFRLGMGPNFGPR